MEPRELVHQFVQHRDVLYGYVLALTGEHDLAEDILQDIGVSILTEAARENHPESFMPWARALARHRVADHFRRQASRRLHEIAFDQFADAVDTAFAEYAPTPEDNQRQLKFLRQCLDGLTSRIRTMIDLRYRGGQSMEQIAIAMSWTPGSVKVALSRARRCLADCVQRKLRQEDPG